MYLFKTQTYIRVHHHLINFITVITGAVMFVATVIAGSTALCLPHVVLS